MWVYIIGSEMVGSLEMYCEYQNIFANVGVVLWGGGGHINVRVDTVGGLFLMIFNILVDMAFRQ